MEIKKYFLILILVLFVAGCSEQYDQTSNTGKQNMQSTKQILVADYPIEDLSQDEIDALIITLEDEYKARALYKKVIEKFGEVRPFTNIINAEVQHADALIVLFEKYDLEIPEDNWYDKVPEYDSVKEACEAGVQAEIENAALYDGLFEKVDNQDITVVFTSLRDASQNNHLPAFQRCGGLI